MGRRRQSTFEDLIDIASFLPWWISILLAIISYLTIHYFAVMDIPHITGSSQMGAFVVKQLMKSLAVVFQYVIPFAFILGAIISAVRQWKKKSLFEKQTNLDSIKQLGWQAFELLISEAYRRKGYQVTDTKDGPDGGIDIILKKDGKETLVQCKHWKAQKVGVKEVRELNGIVAARGADKGILVTSGTFTTEAGDFSENTSIDLIDGESLVSLIPDIKTQNVQSEAKPLCPRCKSDMVLRTARKGTNAGNRFWGCSTFPKCKGVINLTTK